MIKFSYKAIKFLQSERNNLVHVLIILIVKILDIHQNSDYLYPTTTQHTADNSTMAVSVTVAVSVVSFIFILACITLVFWRLKYRNLANRKPSKNIQPLREKGHDFLDTNEATKTYCSSDDSRPGHKYTSSMEVSTDLTHPSFDRNVLQRESTASTIIFDINSCTYEPVLYAFEEDNIAKV